MRVSAAFDDFSSHCLTTIRVSGNFPYIILILLIFTNRFTSLNHFLPQVPNIFEQAKFERYSNQAKELLHLMAEP